MPSQKWQGRPPICKIQLPLQNTPSGTLNELSLHMKWDCILRLQATRGCGLDRRAGGIEALFSYTNLELKQQQACVPVFSAKFIAQVNGAFRGIRFFFNLHGRVGIASAPTPGCPIACDMPRHARASAQRHEPTQWRRANAS